MMFWLIIVFGLDGGFWYDVGYYLWMFYMFFGMCFSWVGVVFVMVCLYYVWCLELFNVVLVCVCGEFLDDVVIFCKCLVWVKKV